MEQNNIVAAVMANNPAFEVECDAIAKALAFMAKHIVERRNTIPILSNVEILATGNAIRIRACDLDIMATITLPATIERAGVTTLSAFTLSDTLKKAGKAPYFKMDANGDGKARIAVGRTIQNLNTLPADDFPVIAATEVKYDWLVECAELAGDWELVRPAISTEETRYYLNGICVDPTGGKLTYAATDGHRLSTVRRPLPVAEMTEQAIIPRKAVAAILQAIKSLPADAIGEMALNPTKLRFTAGNVEIYTKLIDGTFPDYGRVIPPACADTHILDVASAELATHCKAASGKPACLHLELAASGSRVGQTDPEGRWAQPLVATYQGDECSIGFNARYLEQFAKLTPALQLAFYDAASPTRVTSPDLPHWQAMIMPMRLGAEALPAESVVEFAPVMAAPGQAADLFDVHISIESMTEKPRAATVDECVAYMTDYARRLGIEFDHVKRGTCSSISLCDADGNELQQFTMPHADVATVVTVETLDDEGNWTTPRPCLNGKGEIAAPVQRKERKTKAPKVKAATPVAGPKDPAPLPVESDVKGFFLIDTGAAPEKALSYHLTYEEAMAARDAMEPSPSYPGQRNIDGKIWRYMVTSESLASDCRVDLYEESLRYHADITESHAQAPADLCNGPMFKGWPWDEVFADIARPDFPTRIECIDGTYSIVNTWTRKGGLQRTRIPVRHSERARELFEAQAARFAAANPVESDAPAIVPADPMAREAIAAGRMQIIEVGTFDRPSPSEAPTALPDENGPPVSGEPEIAPATPVAPEIDGNEAAPVPAMASDDPMAAIMARLEAIEARLAGEPSATPIGATDTPIAAQKRTPAHEQMIRRAWAERAAFRKQRDMAGEVKAELKAAQKVQDDLERKLASQTEEAEYQERKKLEAKARIADLEGALLRERAKRAQSVERSRANHRLARRAIASKGELLTEALKLRTELQETRERCQRAESELAVAKASPTYMDTDGKEFADARAMAMQRANEAVDRAERIAERLATAEATVKRQAGAIEAMDGKMMEMTGRALRAENALEAIQARIERDGQPYVMGAPTVRFRQAA